MFKMISTYFTLGCFVLSSMVVGNAFYQREQFYPSIVYITKSNPSMLVMAIQGLTFGVLLAKLLVKIFFGRLLLVEVERLMEMSWYEAFDTAAAFVAFRDDLSTSFIVWFALLYTLKIFHWMTEERVNLMERSLNLCVLFHIRALSLVSLLFAMDIYLIVYVWDVLLVSKTGDSVQLVFGFEYAICIVMIVGTFAKYVMHVIDRRRHTAWENKSVFMLYNELFVSFLKMALYLMFVCLMMRIYTLPLFALRPFYQEYKNFRRCINGVVMSRRAINIMNTMFSSATEQDLADATDNICIICREEMLPASAKKLPCNHICHELCLRSWFQRQQTCPICRTNILRSDGRDLRPRDTPQPSTETETDRRRMAEMVANSIQQNREGSFVAFIPPPPVPRPPPDFRGLSDEELLRMEGTERRHIEARIECLNNVKVLLDAAVLEMQQYSRIVTNLQTATTTTTPPSVPSNVTNSDVVEEVIGAAAVADDIQTTPTVDDQNATGTRPKTSSVPAETEQKDVLSVSSSDEEMALRKRRVEKFATTPKVD